MYRKILTLMSFVLVFAGVAGFMQARTVSADDKITICHRSEAVKNPYQVNTVAQSSVDGSGGEGDHYLNHKGDLASSESVAQAIKDAKKDWGDIIPPIPGKHDGLNWSTVGRAMYENDCEYVNPTVPANVEFKDISCDEDGSYIIPTTVGVEYYLEGKKIKAGTYMVDVNTSVLITAKAKKGYYLEAEVKTEWSHEFTVPVCEEGDKEVTPLAVEFTDIFCDADGTYTIPSTKGVEYQLDGKKIKAGTYIVDENITITITAIAKKGYKFEDGAETEWSHEFTVPTEEECVEGAKVATPLAATFVAPTCDVLGSYTIPATIGVKYLVNDVVKAAGTYASANGTTVTVKAVAEEGYDLKEGAETQWSYTFTAPTNCTLGTSTTKPTSLPLTSGDSTVATVSLLSIATGVITVLGFAFRSVFTRQF